MEVYHGSGFYEKVPGEEPLRRLPLGQEFVWEGIHGRIPALYLGKKGAVLDVCIRVPISEVEKYLAGWSENKGRHLAEETEEELEKMTGEDPFHMDFQVRMTLDGQPMKLTEGCSTGWHPLGMESQYVEEEAELLVEEYGCDRSYGWLMTRWTYQWEDDIQTEPKCMELTFEAMRIPETGGYFKTVEGEKDLSVQIQDPDKEETYTLTVLSCKNEIRETKIPGVEGLELEYPSHYQAVEYGIRPDLSPEEFQIRDCAQSDPPRPKDGGETGAVAVFMAGSSGAAPIYIGGEKVAVKAAFSSMHFEPVEEVTWRAVFYRKRRTDMTLTVKLQEADTEKERTV